MARRYVRDKIGRFAAKGGGGKRAGKLSKSTGRGRSAKAAYHDAKSDLRFEKRVGPASGTKNTRAIRKSQKKLTTLSNQMTGKGKAAGSGIKKGLRSQTASRRKQSFRSKATKGRAARAEYKAASRKDRKIRDDAARKKVIKKQTGKPAYRDNTGYFSPQRTKQPRAGSRTKAQRLKDKIESRKNTNKWMRGSEFKGPKKGTAKQVAAGKKRSAKAKATKAAARKANFKGKATQGRAAKAKYKSAASKLRKKTSGVGINTAKGSKSHKKQVSTAKGQLTRVTNKLAGKGRGSAATKSFARGPKQARGVKKRRGAKVYDNTTNTSIKMKTVKKNLRRKYPESKAAKSLEKRVAVKKKVKAPTAFSGTGKYARQGKLSKASKGSGAKQKYKKATSELRKSKRGQSLFKQSQMGHPSKVRQGQVTRLTNKFTNKRKAKGSLKDLEKKITKKTKRSASNKIVKFNRKKKR